MTRLTDADIADIRRYYGNHPGKSYRDVAKVFNTSKSTVERVLKTAQPVGFDTPSNKKHAREGTRRDTVPGQLAVKQEQPRTDILTASAKVEAEHIMGELVRLYNAQMSELQDLKQKEADYKKQAEDLSAIRNRIAIGKYHIIYKQLKPEGKVVVDALVNEQRYKDTFQIYMMSAAALDSVKATLAQMATLQKNIVMYFDNRQATVIQVCPKCSRPLRERIAEYEEIWPQEELNGKD